MRMETEMEGEGVAGVSRGEGGGTGWGLDPTCVHSCVP